ncbi:hypothetical protein ANN_06241 [Periplaneta americana]|uniref:Uncharacterized protein n=1 Tax=Periplaneta americana TaxID=6978 RepID=A0ABQ8TD05_PERAM|nr:hypothetical protein ANN_06241 [Periplaneta americana]
MDGKRRTRRLAAEKTEEEEKEEDILYLISDRQHSLKCAKGERIGPVCPVVQQEEVESIPASSYECTIVQCVLRGFVIDGLNDGDTFNGDDLDKEKLLLHGDMLLDIVRSKLHPITDFQTVFDLLRKEAFLRDMLPERVKFMRLLTIPADLASRTSHASGQKNQGFRLKSYTMSTMGQQRMNEVAIIHSHREEALHLDLDEIANELVTRNEIPRQTFAMKTLPVNNAVCQLKIERKILEIKLQDKVRNEELRLKSSIEMACKTARRLKWKWGGHVARLPADRWAYATTVWDPRRGRRGRGRPRRRWAQDFVDVIGPQWTRIARDREKWKDIILDLE